MAKRKTTEDAPDRVPQGITGVTVRGFKSLSDETHLEIRPLTILAGANSSGKTSAMQPLLLLKQTLEVTYDPGPLLLDGPCVRFTSADQLLSAIRGRGRSTGFTATIEVDGKETLKNVYGDEPGRGLILEETAWRWPEDSAILRRTMSNVEVLAENPGTAKSLHDTFAARDKQRREWVVERERCFLKAALRPCGRAVPRPPRADAYVLSPHDQFEQHLRGVIHVPGLRGNPERTYKTTAVGLVFPGTFENYVASIVAHWKSSRSENLKLLGRALQQLGLTWKVDAKRIDETRLELRVGRLTHGTREGAHDLVSIADVGLGVSQALPGVVALLAARPGQLVYMEQPELHLHPRAQTRLADLLTDAATRGVRVVVETHSAMLLLAIQTLVAERAVPRDLVKLHWFERGRDGSTNVTSADLDETGAFGDWPEDFGGVELKAESRYLDAAEQRRGGR